MTVGYIVVRKLPGGADPTHGIALQLLNPEDRHPALGSGEVTTLFRSYSAARWAIERHLSRQPHLYPELDANAREQYAIKRVTALQRAKHD